MRSQAKISYKGLVAYWGYRERESERDIYIDIHIYIYTHMYMDIYGGPQFLM